jgi:hypothetical protein
MAHRVSNGNQRFKNAAQLHEQKLDRFYKRKSMAIMGQDFWQAERAAESQAAPAPKAEAERAAESKAAPAPKAEAKAKPEAVLDSDWQEYSWESFMEELRRKHESVSDA